MGNEYLAYRFGFMAVKKGFVAPEQVSKALEVQFNENLAAKKHRLRGDFGRYGCHEPFSSQQSACEHVGKTPPFVMLPEQGTQTSCINP